MQNLSGGKSKLLIAISVAMVLLAGVLLLEGCGLILFAQAGSLFMAIVSMLTFAMFLKMSNGATYGIVPFVNTKNVGLVSGIVGAGGNVGGMLFGFLFKSDTITYVQAFTYIGYIVIVISVVILITRFKKQTGTDVQLNKNMAGSAA